MAYMSPSLYSGTLSFIYCIAGNFRGVLIFVVGEAFTKFSTMKIYSVRLFHVHAHRVHINVGGVAKIVQSTSAMVLYRSFHGTVVVLELVLALPFSCNASAS